MDADRRVPRLANCAQVAAQDLLADRHAIFVAQASGVAVGRLWRWPARRRVATLEVGDIDSERMLMRGKRGQYRNATLAADRLALLRQWWKVGREQVVMHPHGRLSRPACDRS